MPNDHFPDTHPITDLEDWTPDTLDKPNHASDKVAKVFQDASVGAARKIVAIANGDYTWDPEVRGHTTAIKIELEACKYIVESVHTPLAQEQPWQEWARQLIKDPTSIPKEPAFNSLPGGVYLGENDGES